MPFLDDIPIKKYIEDKNNEILDKKRCCKFLIDYIIDCENFLRRLKDVHLILPKTKPIFGIREILVVEHMHRPYGQKPSMEKIDSIKMMYKHYIGLKVFRSMYLLLYLDFYTLHIYQIHYIVC